MGIRAVLVHAGRSRKGVDVDDFDGMNALSRTPGNEPDTLGPEAAGRALPFYGEEVEPTLLELQRLPDTLLVGDELDAARMQAVALAGQPHRERDKRRAQNAVRHHEKRYAHAVMRDALQSDRPAGCWCLGYGGSTPRYLPMMTGAVFTGHDGAERNEIEEREVLGRYCDCPEGLARKVSDQGIRTAYWEDRDRRAIVRRFGEAHLPPEYRTYPWRDHPDSKTVRRVSHWLADPMEGPDAKHWLLMYGLGGRGKTTIAAGMAAELVLSGASVLFRTMPDLLAEIKATFGKEDGETDVLRDLLCRVRWLFLDDIGAEAPRDWVGEFVYAVLNHRHNHHMRTVFTSNLDPRELGEHIGERIWGRFKRMAEPVEMAGTDLRDVA
jgi:DNA replication protein DnaC